METYVILRRSGWRTPDELQAAAARSTEEGDRMPDDIRWIRSYVLAEPSGELGTVCIYQARAPRRSAPMPTAQACPSTRSWPWQTPSSSDRIRFRPRPEREERTR